jgi:hypothetical protein
MWILLGRAAGHAGTAGAGAGADRHSATRGQLERVGRRVCGHRVNTHDDPLEDAVADAVAEVDVVEDGVRGCVGRLLLTEHVVLGVGGQGYRVGVVGAELLDGVGERLVPEELANMGHVAHGQGSVRQLGRVDVHNTVHVVGAAAVVAAVDSWMGR